ncbi:MAG: DUF1631 family protein [Rhodocyclaceae bacterium]|jgi:hypothetical protein|nr:DUF1631 family protein [Rhodocyclaceae bacterium]
MNVVKLENYTSGRADVPFRPYAGVLAECRRLVADRLGATLADAVEPLDKEVHNRRIATADASEADLLVEVQFQLRSLGNTLNRRFHEVFEREFQYRITPITPRASVYGGEGGSLLELSLADDDQISDELLLQNLARQLGNPCEAELKDLRARVGHMLGETHLRDSRDPIGPDGICAALKEICWQLDTARPARARLLALLASALQPELPALYREINTLLIARKVLPRVRHAVKRDKPRVSARESVPRSDEDTSSGEETQGILHRLFTGGGEPGGQGGFPAAMSRAQRGGEILLALTQLQQGQAGVAVGSDSFSLPAGAGPTTNVLHGLIEAGIGRHLGSVDAIIIDVVAALFDYIFDDPHVPELVKGLIGRLQIPVLKLAMLDHGFFSNRTHPARRLINTLAQSAAGWDGEFTSETALFKFAEPLVVRIQDHFAEDNQVFTDCLAQLEAFLAEQERLAEEKATTLTDELEQQERLEIARLVARDATTPHLENPALPEAVRHFIGEVWLQVLVKAALAGSADGGQWQEAAATMEDLAWSVQPLGGAEDRQRLVKLLPSLIGGLRRGMEAVGTEDAVRDAFFAELMKLHAAAVKAGMNAQASPPPAAPIPAAPPQAETELPAEEGDLGPLVRGTWINLRERDGGSRRMRLNWISPARTMYLFTNHQGQGAMALTQAELAARFTRGDAFLDDDLPLLDRIVDNVLEDFDTHR